MNKKTKTLTISLLGLLLFLSFQTFIGPSRAHYPYYVGVLEGDHEEWDVYIWTDNFDLWNDDDMTDVWAEVFEQTFLDNMTAVYEAGFNLTDRRGKVDDGLQCVMSYTVDEIITNTGGFDENSDGAINTSKSEETFASMGETLVQLEGGAYMDGSYIHLNSTYASFPNGVGIFIAEDPEDFAEDIGYGAMATSLIWATNMFNAGNNDDYGPATDMNYTNTLFFAPNNLTMVWADVASECDTELEADYGIFATYGYDLTVSALSNGFTMFSDVGDFGSNTENITITTTYDYNGLLTYYSFEYGNLTLTEISHAKTTNPMILKNTGDIIVDHDYANVTISWTVKDADPGRYTITKMVKGAFPPVGMPMGSPPFFDHYKDPWSSMVPIVFDVPDGLEPGKTYVFKLTAGDGRPNHPNEADNTIEMTVRHAPVDATGPIIIAVSVAIGFLAAVAAIVAVVVLKDKKKRA